VRDPMWGRAPLRPPRRGRAHSRPSTQPSPETHRTGLPALLSTSDSVSSSGKLRVHASSPSSAISALSGWGFSSDRRRSSRRRRSSSWRTASATNLLRFFSRRSMSLTRSIGRVTVTRPTLAISYSQYDHTAATASKRIGGRAPGCFPHCAAALWLTYGLAVLRVLVGHLPRVDVDSQV